MTYVIFGVFPDGFFGTRLTSRLKISCRLHEEFWLLSIYLQLDLRESLISLAVKQISGVVMVYYGGILTQSSTKQSSRFFRGIGHIFPFGKYIGRIPTKEQRHRLV